MKSRKGYMGFDEYAVKTYAHFDHRVSYAKVKKLVEDPEYVSHHGFLPLISKVIARKKYDGEVIIVKTREVAYASHVDRCIYQRYSYLLNKHYNKMAEQRNINNAAIAYRNNLRKSNIDFACSAFTKMLELTDCWVMVADFKNFFPSLDHTILKQRLRTILRGSIPDDHYIVYKAATRYSQWDLTDLMKNRGLDSSKHRDVQAFNRKSLAISRDQFRNQVKIKVTQPWRETHCGIPQGLPISGVMANIYMLEFDTIMALCAETSGGMYMRYSDDIILILPDETSFKDCLNELFMLCNKHKLTIEQSKTLQYVMRDGRIYLNGKDDVPTKLQYLGFDFDGSSVRLRQRTIGNYYSKMHRAAKRIFYNPVRSSRKQVFQYYQRFSNKGIRAGRGNFLTYSKRAEKQFRQKAVSNKIGKDTLNHYLKMRRASQRIRDISE